MSDEDTSVEDGDPPPGDGGQLSADELLGRIREYDETLADDVRRIIERGAELHDAAGELERTLEQRNAEIVELEAALNRRDERIEALEEKLEERAQRVEELAAELDGEPSGAEPDPQDTEREADEAGAEDDGTDQEDEEDDRAAELQERLDEREETIADLRERLDDRDAEVEDLTKKLRRKQADFENYKKRAERKRERIRERATEDLVERLLDVRDNLKRATQNDHENVEGLLDGVEMTLREFDRVLEDENVVEIAPEPGDEIDPQEHEVMMRVDSKEPEDTVADLYAPGYRMADKVIRPAQVTVSTGPAGDEADDAAASEEGTDDAATATAQDHEE